MVSRYQPNELRFLRRARLLGRLATLGRNGTPHVVPVGWTYHATADTVDVGGRDFANTKKYNDVARHGRAAIDEVLEPWQPRGIEIRGMSEAVSGPDAMIRIHPDKVRSWGLDGG
jgi:pyridoxamine 5'-phosphate oxidase family protein